MAEDKQVTLEYAAKASLELGEVASRLVDLLSIGPLDGASAGGLISAEVDCERAIIVIRLPAYMLEQNNISQWLKLLTYPTAVGAIRLSRIDLPQYMGISLQGPRFGAARVKEMVGVARSSQPLLCYMHWATGPQILAETAYAVVVSGANVLLDSEILGDQEFCRLEARTSLVSEAIDSAEQETGRRCMFCANVTSDFPELLERADVALDNGAGGLMVSYSYPAISEVKALSNDPTLSAPVFVGGSFPVAGSVSDNMLSGEVSSLLLRVAGADLINVRGGTVREAVSSDALSKELVWAPNASSSICAVEGPADPFSMVELVGLARCELAILLRGQRGQSKDEISGEIRRFAAVVRSL